MPAQPDRLLRPRATDSKLVVVGASLAGLRAVQSARRAGFVGSITLVGAEEHLPYDRTPLSKAYLDEGGKPTFFIESKQLRDLDVHLLLQTAATGLDTTAKEIVLGEEYVSFDYAVLATGASPRRIPSFPNLHGIVTLRTLDDATRIRARLNPGLNVVVVGGGFIGSEIASSARTRGANVTILEAAPIPLVRAVGEVVGAAISNLHERNHVHLILSAQIQEVRGKDDKVVSVILKSGELIPADLVIVGVGAAPVTSWLVDSNIELDPIDGGVMCDVYLETSAQDVYAAGDIVHWPNAIMDGTMRLENWTNASDQGDRAGWNAVVDRLDRRKYETVPYFWSDWYGQRIQFVGIANADQVYFASGGPNDAKFVALYRSGDRLVGVATLNEQRKIMKFRRLIQNRGSWDEARALLLSMQRETTTS